MLLLLTINIIADKLQTLTTKFHKNMRPGLSIKSTVAINFGLQIKYSTRSNRLQITNEQRENTVLAFSGGAKKKEEKKRKTSARTSQGCFSCAPSRSRICDFAKRYAARM